MEPIEGCCEVCFLPLTDPEERCEYLHVLDHKTVTSTYAHPGCCQAGKADGTPHGPDMLCVPDESDPVPVVDFYAKLYGEEHRVLIADALQFLAEHEARWKLTTPIKRSEFILLLLPLTG